MDVEFLCTDYKRSLLGGTDVVSDLGAVGAVIHEKCFQLLSVINGDLLESVGQKEPGLLVAPVSDLGHAGLACESASHRVVDAMGLSPAGLHLWESIP